MVESGWYFNRAVYRFLADVEWLLDARRGTQYVCDDVYYAKAVLNARTLWGQKSQGEDSFEQRGLVSNTLFADQQMFLQLRIMTNLDDLLAHMHSCLVWYEHGVNAIEDLD